MVSYEKQGAHTLSASFHLIAIGIARGTVFFLMKASLYELSVHAKTVYAARYIYLTPFAYLQAPTLRRTLPHLSVFPDETVAADLRQICLILDLAHLFAFGVTCSPANVVRVAASL